jgi:hypothetical protein
MNFQNQCPLVSGVVLAEDARQLQRIALHAQLIMNVNPAHPALVIAHNGRAGDSHSPTARYKPL